MLIVKAGAYAAAMNIAAPTVTTDFIFTGADDLFFTEGWLEAAIRQMEDGVQVVGVNDGQNNNNATHFLIRTGYQGVFDRPGLMHEYHHNYCDTELRDYATHRGVYRYAQDSLVEHRHWIWGLAQQDATYRKGAVHMDEDRATYKRRKSQWGVTAKSWSATFTPPT